MEDRVFEAALAGLLHDVGKFARWGGERQTQTALIADHLPAAWQGALSSAVANRLQPQSRLDHALALAERLAAGQPPHTAGDQPAAPTQMRSIFCDLIADGQKAPQPAFLPLAALRLQREVLFPGPAWDSARVGAAYRQLWQALSSEARALKNAYAEGGDGSLFLENWLLMLQRLAWSVPAPASQAASLYDHSRMRAALAAVLVDSPLSDEELAGRSASARPDEQPLALLVSGDLSGVQAFIYTITARGATSALRGRSFYLQLLSESLARAVLRHLDLPITNLIYAAGGRFSLLARAEDAARLPQVQRAISQALFYHHRGDLYLALAGTPLAQKDFEQGEISRCWEELGRKLEHVKQQRFAELGGDLALLFAPQGHGGNQDELCQVCGMEHPDTRPDEHASGVGEEQVRKCPSCLEFEALGEALRHATCLALEHLPLPPPPVLAEISSPGAWPEVLACLGMRAAILANDDLADYRPAQPVTLLALTDDALAGLKPRLNAHTALGRRLLVNVTPLLRDPDRERLVKLGLDDLPPAGRVTPFHALAKQSAGIPRLGVLRMDVDNLGKLFAEGLGQQSSLSRIATLSMTVSLYFEGWVEVLAEDSNRRDRDAGRGDRLYSIYSGGDDLFFVGAWDAVAELARQIRIDLGAYAAGHRGVHLSGGLVLVGGKYPLAQAAEDARRAEDQAKAFVRWEGNQARRKDAFCFLGQALDWEHFGLEACDQPGLQSAHALMHLLIAQTGSTQVPLVRRLIDLHARYQQAQQARALAGEDRIRGTQAQTLWGPWNWLADYSLYRLVEHKKENQTIETLRTALKDSQFRSIEWTGLAARWAELRLR